MDLIAINHEKTWSKLSLRCLGTSSREHCCDPARVTKRTALQRGTRTLARTQLSLTITNIQRSRAYGKSWLRLSTLATPTCSQPGRKQTDRHREGEKLTLDKHRFEHWRAMCKTCTYKGDGARGRMHESTRARTTSTLHTTSSKPVYTCARKCAWEEERWRQRGRTSKRRGCGEHVTQSHARRRDYWLYVCACVVSCL